MICVPTDLTRTKKFRPPMQLLTQRFDGLLIWTARPGFLATAAITTPLVTVNLGSRGHYGNVDVVMSSGAFLNFFWEGLVSYR